MRYNISTSDYMAWDRQGKPMTDHRHNAYLNRRRRRGVGTFRDPLKYQASDLVTDTSSPIMQDPIVGIGEDPAATFLELNLNTNQYGRTFQDRSYVFEIKERPTTIAANVNIYNVNVRGKRGNIVQTYPAVEYDFVPNDLCLQKDDYVHFQWTGSDYNPRRGDNNGAGAGDIPPGDVNKNSRADRSNIVEQSVVAGHHNAPFQKSVEDARDQNPGSPVQNGAGKHEAETPAGMNYPAGYYSKWSNLSSSSYTGMFWTDSSIPDKATIMKLAFLEQAEYLQLRSSRCKTLEELLAVQNRGQRERDPKNCGKLNARATPYFDGGLVKMQKPGFFHYFSTRNNNFSNRKQQGAICVAGQLNGATTGQCASPLRSRGVYGTCLETFETRQKTAQQGESLYDISPKQSVFASNVRRSHTPAPEDDEAPEQPEDSPPASLAYRMAPGGSMHREDPNTPSPALPSAIGAIGPNPNPNPNWCDRCDRCDRA